MGGFDKEELKDICIEEQEKELTKLRQELTQAREEVERLRQELSCPFCGESVLIGEDGEAIPLQNNAVNEQADRANKAAKRAEKAEDKVKTLDKKLFLEGVKNNSNVARVEFLEGKNRELEEALKSYVACSVCGESLRAEEGTTVKDLVEIITFQNNIILPCIVSKYGSNVCSFGTKGCVASHEGQTSEKQRAEADSKRYREALEKACLAVRILYGALDDIDTAGDMFKPELNPYFYAIQSYHGKRHSIATTDGHELKLPFEKALIDTEGES